MKRVLLIVLIATALVGVMLAPASTVMAASATRSLPSSAVAGADFDVDISTFDYGAFGQVVETLPVGFSYVSSNLSSAAVDVDGQVVTFTLLGETTFSYNVTAASTAGSYTFGGILKDEDKVEYTLGGDVQITVPANRSLPSSVIAGANFNVSISTFDYGAFGQVVETLPAGFSYVSSNLSLAAVDVDGQVVTFTLLGETTFSYTVKASSSAGSYTFSGILKDEDKNPFTVGGQAQITVTAPTRVGGGGGGGPGAAPSTVKVTVVGTTVTSADGTVSITIPEGTIALDKDGKTLTSLTTDVDTSPPAPPAGDTIIGLVYNFGPVGATFAPPIPITFTYDPGEIPAGTELIVMKWDGDANVWVELSKGDYTVDTDTNTITLLVSGFSKYAIIARAVVVVPPVVTPPVVTPAPEKEAPPVVVAPPPVAEPPVKEEAPEAPAEPTNWLLIGGIIAAVVAVALLIYFLVIRRRTA